MFCCGKQSPSPSNLKSLLSQNTYLCGEENINNVNSSLPTNMSDSSFGNKMTIKSRSKKMKIENDYEISFEKGILVDHKISFKNIFSNYSKQVSDLVEFSQFKILQFQNQNSQLQDSFENSQLTKIIQSCELLNEQQQNQFIQDLKSEQNLSNFILYMLKNICEQAKTQLIFIISIIWEQYLIQTKSVCRIKNLIDKIRTHIKSKIIQISRHCIYITCGDKIKKSSTQAYFTTLIHSLIQSVVLVIQGYFESSAENINDDILVPTGKFSQLSIDSK